MRLSIEKYVRKALKVGLFAPSAAHGVKGELDEARFVLGGTIASIDFYTFLCMHSHPFTRILHAQNDLSLSWTERFLRIDLDFCLPPTVATVLLFHLFSP